MDSTFRILKKIADKQDIVIINHHLPADVPGVYVVDTNGKQPINLIMLDLEQLENPILRNFILAKEIGYAKICINEQLYYSDEEYHNAVENEVDRYARNLLNRIDLITAYNEEVAVSC
jgi:hypothetical protein